MNKDKNVTEIKSSMSDSDFYWDWIKHADHLFIQRSLLFVIAETALFAALSSFKANDSNLIIMIYSLGVLVSLNWTYVGYFYSYKTQIYIKKKFNSAEPRFEEYGKNINNGKLPANINAFLGLVLPCSMTIAWFILILLKVNNVMV